MDKPFENNESFGFEIYPETVFTAVRNAFSHSPNARYHEFRSPEFRFPTHGEFNRLVQSALNASLSTEEKRSVRFRLLFVANPGSLANWLCGDPMSANPWFYSGLAKPIPLTDTAVRALAPAVNWRESFIVTTPSSRPQVDSIEIIGILSGASNALAALDGLSFSWREPPPAFAVRATGAGKLVLSEGIHDQFDLQLGRFSKSKHSGRRSKTADDLNKFVFSEADALEAEVAEVHKRNGRDTVRTASAIHFQSCFNDVLRQINVAGHGGTLIVVDMDYSADDERLRDVISLKYVVNNDRMWNALLAMWGRDLCDRTAAKGGEEISTKDWSASFEERRMVVTEATRFVAQLSQVDGAVVVNKRLRVLGFGGEVTVTAPSLSTIDEVQPDGSLEPKKIQEFGTRHRSAIRFVSAIERCAAFVISSDGGIRGFRRIGQRVRMWKDINLSVY